MRDSNKIKNIVKKSYAKIAQSSDSCGCGDCSCGTYYSEAELRQAPIGSNLGLGCGNPVAIAFLKRGDVVLDLGSGAGFDAFLAAKKVGKSGRVIGIDMTDEMVKKARLNARKGGFSNVEFKKGDIENLPVKDSSVDVIISNCVINLAPSKEKVFKEAFRTLKKGGRLMISDIVLTKPLPEEFKNDEQLLVDCIGGAIIKQDYLSLLEKAGFSDIKVHKEKPAFLKDYGLSITCSAVK